MSDKKSLSIQEELKVLPHYHSNLGTDALTTFSEEKFHLSVRKMGQDDYHS